MTDTTEPTEPAEPKDPEVLALEAEYAEILASNHKKEARLRGYGAGLIPAYVVEVRLNMLTDLLVGKHGELKRIEYEIEFQKKMQATLDAGLDQAVAQEHAQAEKIGGLVVPGKQGLVLP